MSQPLANIFGGATSQSSNLAQSALNVATSATAPSSGLGLATTNTSINANANAGATAAASNTGSAALNEIVLQPGEHIWDKIMLLKEAYDPSSKMCLFKHYMYNTVEPSTVSQYTCAPGEDPRLYYQATQDNPDPQRLVPALASGYGDLRKRAAQQDKLIKDHSAIVIDLQDRIDKVALKNSTQTAARIAEQRRRQSDLAFRVMILMHRLQSLRTAGAPLDPSEIALTARIEQLSSRLGNTNISNQQMMANAAPLSHRVNSLWSHLQNLQALHRAMPSSANMASGANVDLNATNPAAAEQLAKLLQDQQTGIIHLKNVLQADSNELAFQMQQITRH
ncbi:hypothetical protein GQ42DRAFT_161418 [Ramicandelaber brevisporus]|nr:hypothetical protein GQ42DRAFT_161418 [Ramicandelaber brevisporus]